MKILWFIGGILFTLAYAGLRLLTYNGASPAWAAHLRPLALALAVAAVCFFVSKTNQTDVL